MPLPETGMQYSSTCPLCLCLWSQTGRATGRAWAPATVTSQCLPRGSSPGHWGIPERVLHHPRVVFHAQDSAVIKGLHLHCNNVDLYSSAVYCVLLLAATGCIACLLLENSPSTRSFLVSPPNKPHDNSHPSLQASWLRSALMDVQGMHRLPRKRSPGTYIALWAEKGKT